MPSIPLRFCVAFLLVVLSNAALAGDCYVIGDTAQNQPSKPLGSRQNPFGSLAAVEADASCVVITVLHSGTELDGGIILQDGQRLFGKKGPAGELPVITNNAVLPHGYGVVLARDNRLKALHLRNTQDSGIIGSFQIPPFDFGGDVKIQDVLVTGANQSGRIIPEFGAASPSIVLAAATDANIVIKNSEIGAANVSSIVIFQVAGHGDVRISNTIVRDQGQQSEAPEFSPGIFMSTFFDASMDVAVIDTAVSNIGSDFVSNSDGLLLLAGGSGEMIANVDGYQYSNPDGGGAGGSSTAMEIGLLGAAGGTFDGTVENSRIYGPASSAIQLVDQAGGGSNILSVHLHDNEIYDAAGNGISVNIGFGSSYGTSNVTIENNLIVNVSGGGIAVGNAFDPQNVLNVLVQRNTVIDSGLAGLAFSLQVGASAATLNLDAGLGGLGSEGNNRIIGSQFADIVVETVDSSGFPPTPPFTVDAANNWWGSADGPATVVQSGGATVDVDPWLTTDPN